ncbi:hypothetical protein B484DRAFT_453459 [Ochromonadaceae sp. CCMP2298]|nr:hypothetical protein B484DRAFT_453459 [Ochromonadaceae sp. CCMP2298]
MKQAVSRRKPENAAGDHSSVSARANPTETRSVPEPSAAGARDSTSPCLKEVTAKPPDAVVVGKLRLRITAVKYLRIANPKLSLQLDGSFLQRGIEPTFQEFEKTFDVLDIASDLSISVTGREGGKAACGVIVIAMPTLLTFAGASKPPKEQWMMLLPVAPARWAETINGTGAAKKAFKFVSGYADLPGYALTRSKVPLGFLRVVAELTLSQPAMQVYTLRSLRTPVWRSTQATAQDVTETVQAPMGEESTPPLLSNAELCALTQRDLARITALFRLPLTLTSFLSMPEAAVSAMVRFIANSQRTFAHVVVWNEPVMPSQDGLAAAEVATPSSVTRSGSDIALFLAGATLPGTPAFEAAAVADIGQLGGSEAEEGVAEGKDGLIRALALQNAMLVKVHHSLHQLAHNLETAFNALSFADSRITLICYAALFLVATATSLILAISPRLCAFFGIVLGTVLCACGALLLDCVDAKAGKGASPKLQAAAEVLDRLAGLWSRIPDELELVHRHIAGTSNVVERGSEMLDAAAAAALSEKRKT